MSRDFVRPRQYDFASTNVYFVTLSVYQRVCALGEVRRGEMVLNGSGHAVQQTWDALTACFSWVVPDALVIMPNHIHAIFAVPKQDGALDTVMRAFKSMSTLACNGVAGRTGGRFWQSGYDHHPIRDDNELRLARQYLMDDPAQWANDDQNPANCVVEA